MSAAKDSGEPAILLIDCVRLEVNANAGAAALFGLGDESGPGPDAGADVALERVLQHFQADDELWLREMVSASRQYTPSAPLQRPVRVRDAQGNAQEVTLQLEGVGRQANGQLLVILQKRAMTAPLATGNHASLSILAGGIAHDFNNLLVGVMGNLDLARYAEDLSPDTLHHLDAALDAAERAAELCRQLLAYSGRAPARNEVKDLNTELRRITPLLQRVVAQQCMATRSNAAAPPHIALIIEPTTDELPALIDSGLIVQLLLNLVSNAAEACAAGGSIHVRTRAVQWPTSSVNTRAGTHGELSESTRWVNHAPAAGNYVQLEISDNGTGMSDSVQARMFEPFFSSHGDGRGLGLPAAYGIVQQHGGCIALRSQVGRGTSIDVLLPAAHPSMPAHTPVAHQPRTGTVLIVDDEPAVRDVLQLQIERLGYRTAAVSNGQLAIEYVHAQGAAVRAVVLDQTMPVMGGAEAYRRLRETSPTLPIIMTTGYSEETLLELIAHDQHAAFLPKPFAIGRLREVLEQISA